MLSSDGAMGDQRVEGNRLRHRSQRSFYRVVRTDPPTREDFLSHEALGIPPRNPDDVELWRGVSVQSTEQQARQRARLPGFGRFIAELVIADDSGIIWRRTGRQAGHHTLWGDPDAMLACVVRTIPV